jgi:hypothetical protein
MVSESDGYGVSADEDQQPHEQPRYQRSPVYLCVCVCVCVYIRSRNVLAYCKTFTKA